MVWGPLTGWRVDHVLDDGTLVPPIARRYWPDLLRPDEGWLPGLNIARCLRHEHLAPSWHCACGIRALRSFEEAAASLRGVRTADDLDLADELTLAALSRVTVQGLILTGVDIPDEDPPSTVRAAAMTLLEVNLAPSHAHLTDIVQERYPDAAVYGCEGEDWTADVDPEPAFWADVGAAGFGRFNVAHPDVRRVLRQLADGVVELLRDDTITPSDCASMAFDLTAGATVGQCMHFVQAVVEHFAPEHAGKHDQGTVAARPIGAAEAAARRTDMSEAPATVAALHGVARLQFTARSQFTR